MAAALISSSIGARKAHLWLSVERGNWHLLTKLSIERLAICLRHTKKRYLHQQSKPIEAKDLPQWLYIERGLCRCWHGSCGEVRFLIPSNGLEVI